MIEIHTGITENLDTLDIITDDASKIIVSEVVQGRIIPHGEPYDMAESRITIS